MNEEKLQAMRDEHTKMKTGALLADRIVVALIDGFLKSGKFEIDYWVRLYLEKIRDNLSEEQEESDD